MPSLTPYAYVVSIVFPASQLIMTLNVEAYEYTPLAQHGVGLRLFVGEMLRERQQVVPGSDGGILLAPGTRAELTLQRHVKRDVTDDVGNNHALLVSRYKLGMGAVHVLCDQKNSNFSTPLNVI